MRAPAFVALVVMVAGCIETPAIDDSLRPEPAQDLVPNFSEPSKIASLRNNQGETFVAVSADGQTILTCLHGEFKEPSIMYASTDAGHPTAR